MSKKIGKKKLNGAITGTIINQLATTKKTDEKIAVDSGVSSKTVQRVKSSKADVIERKKEAYIKLIDKFSNGDIKQAQRLAEQLDAQTDIYNFSGKVVGHKVDYKQRLEAIKYIDSLKGRAQPATVKATQNNVYISKELDKYTS